MRSIILLIISQVFLSACNSPMNHRVSQEKSAENQQLRLCFEAQSICARLQWSYGPFTSIEKVNHLLVVFEDREGEPSDLPQGLYLQFYSTMPSMNHAMDDAGYFEDLGGGIFINRHIRYNMGGDWRNELWLVNQQDQIEDQVQWDEFF